MNGVVNFDDFKWFTLWLRQGTTQDFLAAWKQRPDHERKRVLAWLTTNEVVTRTFERKFKMRPLYELMRTLINTTGEPVPDHFWVQCVKASNRVNFFMLQDTLIQDAEADTIEVVLDRVCIKYKRWLTDDCLSVMCLNHIPIRYVERLLHAFFNQWPEETLISAYHDCVNVMNRPVADMLINFMSVAERQELLVSCCQEEAWDEAKLLIAVYNVRPVDRARLSCNADMLAFLRENNYD